MTKPRRVRLLFLAASVAILATWGAAPGTAQLQPSPPVLRVEVTGNPIVPIETLRLAIATAARTALPGALTAQISVLSTTPPLEEMAAGSELTLQGQVRVAAPGAAPVAYAVPVRVATAVLPWSDATLLLVSNSPETLPFGKVLYSGSLTAQQTARLLYHHQNGSATQPMAVTVTLSNPTRTPATVWVEGASSGPGSDELALGHGAARKFLEQYWHHAGFLLQLPPNTTLPLFVQSAAPKAIVSGMAQIALVDGERLNLQVAARLANEPEPPTMSFGPNFDTVHQRGVFAQPHVTQVLSYTVGGPGLLMTIGADADLLSDEQSGRVLQGNYGVLYTYRLKLVNPTAAAAKLALVMHAVGGQARGTFLLGDTVMDSPVVLPNAPLRLTTIHLGPLDRRTFLISTMPESGANYPVRLTLSPE